MRVPVSTLSLLGVVLLFTAAAHADQSYVDFQGTLATEQFYVGGAPPTYNTAGTFTGSYGVTTANSAVVTIGATSYTLDEFSQDGSGVYFADSNGDSLNLYFVQGLGLYTSPYCSVTSCPGGASDFSQGPFTDYSVTDSTASYTIVPTAPTPEPSSLMLLGTGVLSLGTLVRRRFQS